MKGHDLAARRGFTILEIMMALGVLTVALVLVAQTALWSLGERTRALGRQEALEQAANILEAARATPVEGLTPQWAAAQRLPESLARQLREGQLHVHVEPEAARPHTRRVTVQIDWKLADGTAAPPVRLVGLFSARSGAGGGKS